MSKKANSKKKQKESLGRSLIKDRFKNQPRSKHSMRHTSELEDGQNYNRINFNSITEQTDVDSFLATAELAGREFKAERLNAKIVLPSSSLGVLTKEEQKKIKLIQEENRDLLRIPRRPPWDRSMDADELNLAEREIFLDWRRALSLLQETEGIVLTPYEKNIEFWRQLWRVIERSDVVVQIVDARNPLLFRCEDLSQYVKEVDCHKENLLLVNKADFLTKDQREKWAEYFTTANIEAVFFSATAEALDKIEEESLSSSMSPSKEDEEFHDNLNNLNIIDEDTESAGDSTESDICQDDVEHLAELERIAEPTTEDQTQKMSNETNYVHTNYINSSKLLNREELIEVFASFHSGPKLHPDYVTVGLVGYPNVGKSSTINTLMMEKKVSVSATPGKTKHFQTLYLNDQILLCDCPGLVFPAFVATKEEMLVSGILPIDEMRYHVPPINLVLSLIPRLILECTYGLKIPPPSDKDDLNKSPTSEEFLNVYGHMRGFMSHGGVPDHPRSARYILKDYINGKLLYCHSPPGVAQDTFHDFKVDKIRKIPSQLTPRQWSTLNQSQYSKAIDDQFFNKEMAAHTRNSKLIPGSESASTEALEVGSAPKKAWRLTSKRDLKLKQKSRRKYSYLDQ